MKTITISKIESIVLKDLGNDNVKIILEDNSKLNILYFSRLNDDISFDVEVKNDAELKFDLILMNGDTKYNLNINVNGTGSNVLVRTLSLAKNATKHFDITINHNMPHSKSEVINDGISFEHGANNFNVIGKINSKMAGSDVRQITHGLILDKTGSCKALPILLIDYHDVKAYHGATIGKINDDDLFYLMSRGLTKNEAFMLVINGILEPFVKDITDEVLKGEIMATYGGYFNGGISHE